MWVYNVLTPIPSSERFPGVKEVKTRRGLWGEDEKCCERMAAAPCQRRFNLNMPVNYKLQFQPLFIPQCEKEITNSLLKQKL